MLIAEPEMFTYEQHWGLQAQPFENVPDPRFYVPSVKHEEARQRILYGIQARKGAVMLTGERASDLAAVEESRVAAVTDRAMTQAAEAAGAAASGIEMPFFSFGGDTSAE